MLHFTNTQHSTEYEMIERKGIGHPDTLADMLAEAFSNSYSRYCLDNFGCVLNHWVDKIVLSGGVAELQFGSKAIVKPMRAYLFGKLITEFKNSKIDIELLFKEATEALLNQVFPDSDIVRYMEYSVDTNCGVGKDHAVEFYSPSSVTDVSSAWDRNLSNDTVMCSGFAPFTFTENLVIELENYLNSTVFKGKYSETGFDIKVLAYRYLNHIDVTICVPFIATKISSFSIYAELLSEIKGLLDTFISQKIRGSAYTFEVHVNTKDRGENVYLTAFGTALDKGDFGAVGRGNKFSGLISLNRETNVEAVAGKNPVNHAGKLYTYAAHRIAWQLFEELSKQCVVNIYARNGDPTNKPHRVLVDTFTKTTNEEEIRIRRIVDGIIQALPVFYIDSIQKNPIESHRDFRGYILSL